MSNKTDPKNQMFMTSLMQLMSKPYIKNPEAFQLAWKSSVFCSSDFGKFFNVEEMAKGIKYKLERDEAIQKLALNENLHKELESVLSDHFKKGGSTTEPSIEIKASQVKEIKSKFIRVLIGRVMGDQLEEIREEEA